MDKSVGTRALEIVMIESRELVDNLLYLSIMEEIEEGECDSCDIVMESADIDTSQEMGVDISEAGAMASECGNVCTPLDLVSLIEAEVGMFSEVTLFDVTTECPM